MPNDLEGIAFSLPYLDQQYALIIDPGVASSPTSFDDLSESSTVGVTAESVASDWAATELAPRGVTIREFDLLSGAFDGLRSREVEAIVSTGLCFLAAAGHLETFALADSTPTGRVVALGVDPTQPELLARVDAALAGMVDDGTYQRIYDRWFADGAGSVAR